MYVQKVKTLDDGRQQIILGPGPLKKYASLDIRMIHTLCAHKKPLSVTYEEKRGNGKTGKRIIFVFSIDNVRVGSCDSAPIRKLKKWA